MLSIRSIYVKYIVMILFFPNLLLCFIMTYDCVTVTCDVTLTLTLDSKNRKEKEKKIQNERENKIKQSLLFMILTSHFLSIA